MKGVLVITNKRNLEIEIYRFLMIIAVSVIHFNEDLKIELLKGGYLGVDFFFVLSGFYLMFYFIRHYKEGEDPNKAAAKYFWYRLKRLYPPYIVAILIMTFVSWADAGFGLKNLYFYIWGNKWQFFMLHSIGAPTSCIMRSIWFMSPLIVLSYVIYLFLCYN